MGRRFAELAFTPLVKEAQERHGSRHQYARMEQSGEPGDRLRPPERTFISQREDFYLSTVSETGWPYIQYRGGTKGFLRVIDDQTLGFADLRGNKQYITAGNLKHDDRIALFLMDYTTQSRLKILGHALIHEGDDKARELIAKLRTPGDKSIVERAVLIRLEAFDWNCPQHIVPRWTEQELREVLAPLYRRLESLETENKRLLAQPR